MTTKSVNRQKDKTTRIGHSAASWFAFPLSPNITNEYSNVILLLRTVFRDEGIIERCFLFSCTEEMIRTHRNLYQFHSMIDCATNLSSSYYYDYGCYCGYGGAGMPVDETDL